MADIHDVMNAEEEVEDTLNKLHETTQDTDIYLSTLAVCRAIIAVGVRLDYVARDLYNQSVKQTTRRF